MNESATTDQVTIYDTIIGNQSTKFTQEVRRGDLISGYEVVEVVDDQILIISHASEEGGFDFFDLQSWDADADGIMENIGILTAISQTDSDYNPFSATQSFTDFITLEQEQPKVNDNQIDFNRTISEVVVNDSGFGYLMPLEIFSL